MTLKRISSDGLPLGVYNIFFYWVRQGKVEPQRSYDRQVPLSYVEVMVKLLRPHEIIEARCQSQNGGLMAFGSEEAKRAWDLYAVENGV